MLNITETRNAIFCEYTGFYEQLTNSIAALYSLMYSLGFEKDELFYKRKAELMLALHALNRLMQLAC